MWIKKAQGDAVKLAVYNKIGLECPHNDNIFRSEFERFIEDTLEEQDIPFDEIKCNEKNNSIKVIEKQNLIAHAMYNNLVLTIKVEPSVICCLPEVKLTLERC